MKVSRDYVVTDHLVDFGDKAFIKAPISNYLKLIGIDPSPPQIALINAINDPKHRFVVGCLSRRTGKTYIANIIAQVLILIPGINVLIMSPNYSLSSISWDLQRELLNKFGIEISKNNAKDRIITLQNGSSVRMGSVSTVDATVGRSYDLILFDEAALNDKGGDAFQVALRPTLDKVNSKAIFISTPRKNNFFKEFYDRGFSPDFPDWVSIHGTYLDNPRSEETDIKAAKAAMSTAMFQQEYLADFTALQGAVFGGFSTETHVIDFEAIASMVEIEDVIAGLDMGYRDPTCLIVALIDTSGNVYIVDSYYDSERTTKIYAENIQPLLDKWEVDFVYIDSAAAQTKADLAQLYDISCVGAKKSINDGIDFVASLVDNNKLFVHYKCTEVINMFENYQWDLREGLVNEKPVHNQHSHPADAVRYALYSHNKNII